MKYSIIIPTYNHCDDLLKPCVDSILKYTKKDIYELIIVANGCTDNTREYFDSLNIPNKKLVWYDEPKGYTFSTNRGIEASVGEYLIFLNNDIVLLEQQENTWLNMLEKPFIEDPLVGLTGPMKEFSTAVPRDFVIFFCAMTSRKMIEKIGMLDEIFSPGFAEDMDYCFRIEEAGYKTIQVPRGEQSSHIIENHRIVQLNSFPIYHAGHMTFKDYDEKNEVLDVRGNKFNLIHRNENIIRERYPLTRGIEQANSIQGAMSVWEMSWLGIHARQSPVIIEIGSWYGRSSRALGDNLRDGGKLYCIDTWQGTVTEPGAFESAKWMDGDFDFNKFLEHNAEAVKSGKLVPLRMHSKHAAKLLKNMGVKADMIFIDAGHTYEEVKEDILMWRPLLKRNGLLCGHDYYEDTQSVHKGVKQAVRELYPNAKVNWNGSIWYQEINEEYYYKPKVYCVFSFFNELDLLEIRFEELWNVVDRFVISEASLTHSGKPKPYYFKENMKRFEKYLSKVSHIMLDDYPNIDPWTIEKHQRNCIRRALVDCNDEDIIVACDADEIPRADKIRQYPTIRSFQQNLYYYNFNCMADYKWEQSKIFPYKLLRDNPNLTITDIMVDKTHEPIPDGGWHFSYFHDLPGVMYKMRSFAHQEYNSDYYINEKDVKDAMENNKDLYKRPKENFIHVELDDTYPKYVLENKEKFAKYIKQ